MSEAEMRLHMASQMANPPIFIPKQTEYAKRKLKKHMAGPFDLSPGKISAIKFKAPNKRGAYPGRDKNGKFCK